MNSIYPSYLLSWLSYLPILNDVIMIIFSDFRIRQYVSVRMYGEGCGLRNGRLTTTTTRRENHAVT